MRHPCHDDAFRRRTYSTSDPTDQHQSESMKLSAVPNSNGDVEFSELNLSEIDPEAIRVSRRPAPGERVKVPTPGNIRVTTE